MAGLKTRVDKLDERVTRVENQVSELTVNVNALVRELKDFKDEMRQQNQMRADEIREIRSSVSNIQNRINDMGKYVRNMSWTSMAAIGAMVVTVIISLLRH